jgi:hypothetical protein
MSEILAPLRSGRLAGATRLDLQGGLTEFPREIFDLADTLEILNLTGNRLRSLPDDLPRLRRLRILFCSGNEFTELPEVCGACSELRMVGFKANQIEQVPGAALPPQLRWLILTDNRIRQLPPELGRCAPLQKLMLSGNCLTTLPEEMAACNNLELLRVAANELPSLPEWLMALPRLAWLAFSGNPCAASPSARSPLPDIPWSDLQLETKLGEGASGEIHRASLRQNGAGERSVAVKLFKGALTSDGLPSCEMKACLTAGNHAHLIPIHGQVKHHPDRKQGLVMSLIDPACATLAAPPSFETCTRDIYSNDLRFSPADLMRLAIGIARAAQHLHSLGILHGDLYAHNILWNPGGSCYLGDFGAATFYDRKSAPLVDSFQRIEVRAFGCLLEELLERGEWPMEQFETKEALQRLQQSCAGGNPQDRPSFEEILCELERLEQR